MKLIIVKIVGSHLLKDRFLFYYAEIETTGNIPKYGLAQTNVQIS